MTPTDDRVLELAKNSNSDIPEPDLPPMQMLTINGVDIYHVDVAGPDDDAPTYLLIHGLGGTHANWEPIIAQLAQRGRVLAPDLAGFGRTDAPADRCSVEGNVELLAAYCAALGVTQVVAVGNSMGGLIAALLTSMHPDLVTRLVLVDPALPLDPRSPGHPMVAVVFGIYLCGPVARRLLPRYMARVGLERLGQDGVRQVVARPERVPEWVFRRVVEETVAHAEAEHGVAAMVRAAQSIVTTVARPTYRRLLGRIRVPVTLLHGDRDALVPVASARRAAAAYPGWKYVEGRDVGHVPMYEVADWVVAHIVGEPAASSSA